MRSFQEKRAEFETRGVSVATISVDPPKVTAGLAVKQGYTFLMLSDEGALVTRRYDLLHEKGGIEGADIARPAEFLIDPSGTIRWRNLTEDYKVRVRAEEILKQLDALTRPLTPGGP